MTIELPTESPLDKLLATFGKQRAIYVPTGQAGAGPAPHMRARKESFLRALFRSSRKPLPPGWIYADTLPNMETTDAN